MHADLHAPEVYHKLEGVTPVMEVLGDRRHGGGRRAAEPPIAPAPSVFWFLFHGEKEPAPQGGTLPATRRRRNSL